MMKHVILFYLIVFSCNSTTQMAEQSKVPFSVILEEAVGGRSEKEIVRIHDKNTLIDIYKEINVHRDPDFVIPNIDFSKDMILVFFVGEKTTGGHSVSVKEIIENSDQIDVYYQEIGPRPTDMVTMVITQPYCIIKVQNVSKELNFIKLD